VVGNDLVSNVCRWLRLGYVGNRLNSFRVWNKSNRMDPTSIAETSYPSGAAEVNIILLNIIFLCSFCRSAFVFLSYFFWTLYCLLFYDWRTSSGYLFGIFRHVELFTIIKFSDAAFENVDINFRNIGHNNISFVSNKMFENLLQLTSL
jgi:hypothetical protein